MSFSFSYSPLILVAMLALAGTVAYWGYVNTTPRLGGSRQLLLASLRFFAFFLVLFLLFQPVLRRVASRIDAPILALLVDDSESLRLTAEDTTVTGTRVVQKILDDLRLPEDAEVRAFRFSGTTSRLPADPSSWSDSITASGDRTDVTGALSEVLRDTRDQNLSGVVLVSDGRYNTGRNPVYAAERYPVPIHTVVVGDTTARRDLSIGRVVANRVAFVGVGQPVRVELRSVGFGGSQVSIALRSRGRVLTSRTMNIEGDETQSTVELDYVPEEDGLHNFTVTVSEMDGEVTHRNNTASFAVRVLDQKRQILLVAGAPGPDVAAVRQILSQASDAELTVRVQKEPGAFYEGTLPDSLRAYDALVLVGYPGQSARRADVERIRQAIDAGLSAFFILTHSIDIPMFSRSLADALPISLERARSEWTEASFILTPAGLQHAVSSVEGVGPTDWLQLPPLRVPTARFQASPDAQILATVEIRGVRLDDPILVVRARGGVRTAAMLGAGTWRWRNVPQDLARWEHLWPTLLSNTIQWISADRDQRPVRVRPARDVFAGSEPAEFVGDVYDERLQPVTDALVELEVRDVDGTAYPFRLEGEGNGQYALGDVRLPEGTYTYVAVARRGGRQLGTDEGQFAVGGSSLEHQDTRADQLLMRQIAHRSGGTSIGASDVATLRERISGTATMEPRVVTLERESNLRRNPLFLIAIVLLLTTEWVLRKRSGLV